MCFIVSNYEVSRSEASTLYPAKSWNLTAPTSNFLYEQLNTISQRVQFSEGVLPAAYWRVCIKVNLDTFKLIKEKTKLIKFILACSNRGTRVRELIKFL
jgi:hypothetical protein